MARTDSPVFNSTVNRLREAVSDGNLLDVGYKAATPLGVSPTTLQRATKYLCSEEGFRVFYLPSVQRQNGKRAVLKVLAPADSTFVDVYNRVGEVRMIEKEKV